LRANKAWQLQSITGIIGCSNGPANIPRTPLKRTMELKNASLIWDLGVIAFDTPALMG
jgi:hypothetical protein